MDPRNEEEDRLMDTGHRLIVPTKHDDKYPLPLGWNEFIGSGGEGKHLRRRSTTTIQSFKASKMKPRKLLLVLDDDYSIFEARYSVKPETNTRLLGVYGPGVVACVGPAVVAAARKHFVWVDEGHIGHRLGAEMAITWLLYFGYEAWKFKQDQQYKMTDFAVALRRKQYDMMVERGIVVNVDERQMGAI
jgi:hypothetical protein